MNLKDASHNKKELNHGILQLFFEFSKMPSTYFLLCVFYYVSLASTSPNLELTVDVDPHFVSLKHLENATIKCVAVIRNVTQPNEDFAFNEPKFIWQMKQQNQIKFVEDGCDQKRYKCWSEVTVKADARHRIDPVVSSLITCNVSDYFMYRIDGIYPTVGHLISEYHSHFRTFNGIKMNS